MKCQECGIKQAHYGVEYKKPIYCKSHKSNDMFDVVSRRCIEADCDKIPSYGFEYKKPIYCKSHKSDNMVNVVSKRCLETDCNKQPSYGLIWKKPIFCVDHKSNQMIDVINKHCKESKCTKQPAYGIEWGKETHCSKHKSNQMINVKSKRCLETDCDKIPNFGLKWGKSTHCGKHKSNDMYNVKDKRCSTCGTTVMNKKYKPNCARCHFYLNPNDPRLTNYKVKEHAFMQPLAEIYSNIILDKTISGGCSRRRPDGFIDCLTHSIIIEIDEDQHVGYESHCDNRRTMELFQDLGERPIIFIRLNPDSYKVNGKTIKGCFSRSKSGELKVIKKEFSKRFAALQESIEFAIQDGMPSKEINSIKLFYSE